MPNGHAADAAALVIGVGGVGCELAAQCPGPRRLVDFDEAALAPYEPAQTLQLPADTAYAPDAADSPAAERAVADSLATLADGVEPDQLAVLVGAVGRRTGAVVLPALAHELKAARCTPLVFALEPLPFEGAPLTELAAQTLDDLGEVADLVVTVPNRPFTEVCDPSLPVHQVLDFLKHKTLDALAHLLDAFTDSPTIGLQPAELRRALIDAGRGAVGVGAGTGERRVDEALRDACANSFLTQESCHRASAAILHLRGGTDVSLQEIYAATDLVAQLVDHVPIQACLSTCDDLSDGVHALLLVTGIRSIEAEAANGEAAAALGENGDLSFYDGVNLDVPAFLRRKGSFRIRR